MSELDPKKLQRQRTEDIPPKTEPDAVAAGPVEKALDLAFNPTREKIREVTIVDRVQGRLFPLLDLVNVCWSDVLEVAYYRQDKNDFKTVFQKQRPSCPNLLEELMYRTAQWQKSVQGVNLTKITDIALAETETRAEDGTDVTKYGDAWGKNE